MLRVIWYQHRTALLWLAAAFGALAAVLIAAGLLARADYASMLRNGCASPGSGLLALSRCRRISGTFPWLGHYFDSPDSGQGFPDGTSLAIQVLFLLTGLFLGAPLLSREFEQGTFRFAWTQGIGRIRWCAMKLNVLGVLVVLTAAGISALAAWSFGPFNELGGTSHWLRSQFGTGPAMAAGWALLAFMTGVAAGALIQRVTAALAATAAALTVLLGLYYTTLNRWLNIRPLMAQDDEAARFAGPIPSMIHPSQLQDAALGVTTSPNHPGPAGALQLRGWYLGPNGRSPTGASLDRLLTALDGVGTYPHPVRDPVSWLARHHYSFWISYQPASRYWLFQAVAGAVLVVAALLLGAAVLWLVRSRGARTRGRPPEPG
jgi:hypothetical protein